MPRKQKQQPDPPDFEETSDPDFQPRQQIAGTDPSPLVPGMVEGTQPVEEPRATMMERAKAAMGHGLCPKCQQERIPDPKKIHRCARCRSELIAPKKIESAARN